MINTDEHLKHLLTPLTSNVNDREVLLLFYRFLSTDPCNHFLQQRRMYYSTKKKRNYTGISISHIIDCPPVSSVQILRVIWQQKLATCSIILPHARRTHHFLIEGDLARDIFCRCTLAFQSGVGKGRNQMGSGQLYLWNPLLRSSLKKLSWQSLSQHGTWRTPVPSNVAKHWALFRWLSSAFGFREFPSIAYY